eukprot:TRINITY_DN1033_c0_g1_i1.p1 TRINITY_DN1033_c0_g1~~TRINITY_DN1033_c0_g1_i1.p1  ORF type:complete len:423 (+),score=99.05 TRINITY_DN1033_c0_g1_i1:65-1333(+)
MASIFKAIGNMIENAAEFIDSRNKIHVSMNHRSYVGGDVIQGVVHLNCLVPFHARGVKVKIKGFERAQWEEWKYRDAGEGQPKERYLHHHKDSKEFFCSHVPVYPHEGTVQVGEYHFPFSFQLPPSLPGTFYDKGGHWSNGSGYSAEVVYYCKAVIDVHFKHDLHHKCQFIINEKFDRNVQPSFASNHKTFMFTPGRLTAKVMLDKNVYFPGNTVIARLEANNTSVKPTNKVTVFVYKHLELRSHGEHWNHRHEVYRQQYPGFEPSFYGVRWLPFQIPINLQPSTTTGHMVKCHYFFVVECDIPGAVDLNVECNTAIMAPQWLFSTAPMAPPAVVLPPDVSFRPPWQPDNQVSSCNSCQKGFSLFKRKHHCRACGKIYCDDCTKKTTKILNLGYDENPVRVCDGCYSSASQGGAVFQEVLSS